jgi:AAA domain
MPKAERMIIELFGPPAAGKTTFARTLAVHLKGRGQPVELFLSVRPEEAVECDDGHSRPPRTFAALRRLTRPAIELLSCIGQTSVGSSKSGFASELLHLLPPASFAWSLRLRQYITRLESSWRVAEQANATVIFDQGFVQVICSLALLVRIPNASALETALALVPKADQWIRVDAPRHLLRARLEARRHGQSWLEQRFEFDTETSLRSIEVLDMLYSLLRRRYPRIAQIDPGEIWPPQALFDMAQSCSAATKADPGLHAR